MPCRALEHCQLIMIANVNEAMQAFGLPWDIAAIMESTDARLKHMLNQI
jgi:hypothetical protein